jgi:cysteine desulfurase
VDGIYLDYNATTPTAPEVVAAMAPFWTDNFANPSSLHRFGQRARRAVNAARDDIARLLGAAGPDEIIFTGGGSEADNLALKGAAFARRDRGSHVITSAVEHPAVLGCGEWLAAEGFDVTFLAPDAEGRVLPGALAAALRPDTILVSVMHANNEVGTIQPVAELAALTHEWGALFHTDAVQSVGKIPVNVAALGVDLLSLSAHKFYGPKGIGALYCRRGVTLVPVIHGGHQEEGRRAGTHNVPGIVGLAAALKLGAAEGEEEVRRLAGLRDRLRDRLTARLPWLVIVTPATGAMPNTLNCCFAGVDGEAVLLGLDQEGIAVSTGSACASGSTEPSHVHLAMGVPAEVARGSIRFSLGRYTREADVDRVVEVLVPMAERLRALSPAAGERSSRG